MDLCLAGPELFLVFPLLEFLRAPFSANKDLEIMTSRWSKDTAEQKQAWIGGFEGELGPMKALGKVVSTVRGLGPTYKDYLGSPYAVHQWSAALSHAYPSAPDQKRVRGLNARLSALLGPAADYRIDDVAAIPNIEGSDHLSTGARLFLGRDKPTLGLVPSVARVGDFICQFWNASAVAVLRTREDGAGYTIVGRGTMLQQGEEIDWDIPLNKTIFQPNATGTVEFDLDLDQLSFLSFDAVNLPGAAE